MKKQITKNRWEKCLNDRLKPKHTLNYVKYKQIKHTNGKAEIVRLF